MSPQCFLFTKNQNERPRKKINKHNAKETWLESYADWQDLMVSCKWYWADFLTWYLTGLLKNVRKLQGKERCYRLVCCLSRLKVPCKLNSSPPRLFHDYFNLWLGSDCGNTTRLILLILRSSLWQCRWLYGNYSLSRVGMNRRTVYWHLFVTFSVVNSSCKEPI